MSTFSNLKNALWAPAKDWTYVQLTAKQVEVPGAVEPKPIEPDQSYVQIRLKSMRIVKARIGARKFYGAIHCYASLASYINGTATFNVVNTPSQLQNVDPKNLGNVIQVDEPLIGWVPYRGDDINIEIGLFSILAANLVDDFLKVVVDLTKAASVSYANQALPFVQPIDNAIHLLLGANQSNKLEIGLKTGLRNEGYYAVVGASKEDLKKEGMDTSSMILDKDYNLFEDNGRGFRRYPYMVFSVETKPKRPDWCKVPEVLKAFNDLNSAIRTGDINTITELFNVFNRVTRTHPDLLLKDAKEIVDCVKTQQVDPWVAEILAKQGSSLIGSEKGRKKPALLELEAIKLGA